MVRQGYGGSDKDRIGKEKTDRPLRGPGTDAAISAKIGGVSNMTSPSSKKNGAKAKGSFPFGKKKGR
jgi:hypothetical protein